MPLRDVRIFGAVLLFVILLLPATARAQAVPGACEEGDLPSGALSLICVPPSAGTDSWSSTLTATWHPACRSGFIN